MAELLERLSEAHAVSGNEDSVRRIIIDEITPFADNVTVDTMGSVYAFKKGKNNAATAAVTVNMDEVGLIISSITDKGYIKFKPVGNIDARNLVSKNIVTQSGVRGVIGMKAIHLQTQEERKKVVKIKDLFIDIGAKDRAQAEEMVSPGDYITFETEFAGIGANIKGKALARSAVCSALADALKDDYDVNFYACFLAQREVGLRGAAVAAHRLKADAVLSISVCDADDIFGQERKSIALGGDLLSVLSDNSMIADRELADYFTDIAKKRGIKISSAAGLDGNSDGSEMQMMNTRTLSVKIPCRYANSPVSIMNTDDINNAADFIKLFLSEIGEKL